MMDNNLYGSFSGEGLYQFALARLNFNDAMKAYALLFEKIIVNPILREDHNVRPHFFKNELNAAEFMSKQLGVDVGKADSIFINYNDFTKCSSDFDSIFNQFREEIGVHSLKGTPLERDYWDWENPLDELWDLSEMNVHRNSIAHDLAFSSSLSNNGIKSFHCCPDFVPQIAKFYEKCSSDITSLFDTDLIFPPLANISWDQIYELRQEGTIKNFRNTVLSQAHNQSAQKPSESLLELFNSDIWSLIGSVEPNLKRDYINHGISNLPSPIGVNPVGIALSVQSILKQHEIRNKYGWLFFVNKIKEKLASHEEFISNKHSQTDA